LSAQLLKIDGFDGAIIGACMTWHGNMLVERVIYSGEKILKELMTRDKMSQEEAEEFITFNMVGAYVGEATPIVMWNATAEDINEYT